MKKKNIALILAFFSIFYAGYFSISIANFASPIAVVQEAKADSNASFYPIWNLLKPEERKMFVSGYLHGWRDSKRVTEILLTHVADKPDSAVSSLEKVRDIYKVSEVPVEQLLSRLTEFYMDPANHNASLSVAISSSR